MMNYGRYRRNPVVDYPEREWPGKEIEKAPVWCSVDLRDGNQALIDPMVVHEKIEMFQYLIKLGFREIEIGFPAASQIEYDFLRQLVDRKMIPQDVWVQVLTQCREEQIERTFESIAGCSQAIVHIYNSTSTLQRDVVFGMDREEIINIRNIQFFHIRIHQFQFLAARIQLVHSNPQLASAAGYYYFFSLHIHPRFCTAFISLILAPPYSASPRL